MGEDITHGGMDKQAQEIADLLDELPWCECTGFLIVEEEEEETPDPALNQYLQAFDVLVFDGYVADFMRLVRGLHEALESQFNHHELVAQVTVPYHDGEDPNQVPLSLMVHYHGPDEGYLPARRAVLDTFGSLVRETVEEWTQEEEEDEEPVETLV
jgi:hypothetical protein